MNDWMYISICTYTYIILYKLIYARNVEGHWDLLCCLRFEGLRFKQWRFCPCIWMMMCSSRRRWAWQDDTGCKDAWTQDETQMNLMNMNRNWWKWMEYHGVVFENWLSDATSRTWRSARSVVVYRHLQRVLSSRLPWACRRLDNDGYQTTFVPQPAHSNYCAAQQSRTWHIV